MLRPGELSVSAVSEQGGEGEDVVACSYAGSEIAVGFNPRCLRVPDAVSAGKLHAWIQHARAATEWQPEGDDSYRYIVMPLPVRE